MDGKHLSRGVRFLFTPFLDWTQRVARAARRKLRYQQAQPYSAHQLRFVK